MASTLDNLLFSKSHCVIYLHRNEIDINVVSTTVERLILRHWELNKRFSYRNYDNKNHSLRDRNVKYTAPHTLHKFALNYSSHLQSVNLKRKKGSEIYIRTNFIYEFIFVYIQRTLSKINLLRNNNLLPCQYTSSVVYIYVNPTKWFYQKH